MTVRFPEIDTLRGLAMVAMILIHTTVFYVNVPLAFLLWNYSQWAVPAFVFCSGYLYFSSSNNLTSLGWNNIIVFFKKRFLRLYIPYFIFMVFFLIAIWLNHDQKFSLHYVFSSIFLSSGIDINWLVLLFLQLTFIMFFVSWSFKKHKILFWFYSFASLLSSVLFLFFAKSINWRLIMWLPWSVIVIFSLLVLKYQHKKNFYPILIFFSGIIFLILRQIEIMQKHSLSFYDNKYPPNIYFLSFGIFILSFLYPVIKRGVFDFLPFKKILHYLSINSYQIYFIHYLILYLLSGLVSKLQHVWIFLFLIVFVSSLLIQWGLALFWKFLYKFHLPFRQ